MKHIFMDRQIQYPCLYIGHLSWQLGDVTCNCVDDHDIASKGDVY